MKTCVRIVLILGAVTGLAYVGYLCLSPSQQRYVRELLRQTPYLIPRYFA